MGDILLEKLFEPERWSYALEKGVDKNISYSDLEKLVNPKVLSAMYIAIRDGSYVITPPRQQKIPKDNGDFRIVYINSNVDRILLSIINDLLFEEFSYMIHKNCRSYLKGISCGKVVKEVSNYTKSCKSNTFGIKADLSKYFDSVNIECIDGIFDKIENRVGQSAVIKVLRDYYHCDFCEDTEGNAVLKYQSLKQGCAVASFLADVMLYDIDEYFTKHADYYVRYSDDLLILGKDTTDNLDKLGEMLKAYGLTLNPKKVEYLDKRKFFKFLGFSIRGSDITLSRNRIETFKGEIEKRTIKNRKTNYISAINSVMNYLYGREKSDMEYCWATSVLSIINVDKDIDTLNSFVMDCIRAVKTNRRKVGGIGYNMNLKDGLIQRGKGRDVKFNKEHTDKDIPGYMSIRCAKNALCVNKELFVSMRCNRRCI